MKYSQKVADKIFELYSTGEHTIKQICESVSITRDTFYRWKKEHTKFEEALSACESQRLDNIKDLARTGLAKMLDVFEYTEEYIDFDHDSEGERTIKSRKIIKKLVMPNPTAVIFALTNRDPKNFKHLQHIDHTSKGKRVSPIDYTKLSDSALKEIINAKSENL